MKRSIKLSIFIVAVALLAAIFSAGAISDVTPRAASSPYSPVATVKIFGRGKAHGVGICMAGALGRVRAGQKYNAIIPKYLLGTRVKTMKLPSSIRVGLYSTASSGSMSIQSDLGCGRYLIRDGGKVLYRGLKGDIGYVRYNASRKSYTIKVVNGQSSRVLNTTSAFVRFIPQRIPLTSSWTILKVRGIGRHFRGTIEFRYSVNSRKLWAINIIRLESYLRGIAEEPNEWPMEGLKLMAVACRSYAASRYYKPKHSSDGFHVCASPHCQYYTGYNREINQPRVCSAVAQTVNQVVTYGGKLIVVPFFSTCGGKTENIENVWGSTPRPYLRGVVCGYCNFGKSFKWKIAERLNDFERMLNASRVTRVPGRLLSLSVIKRGYSPRVVRLRITGTGGSKTVSGTDFYEALGWRSSWFYVYLPPRITSVSWSVSPLTPNGDGVGDVSSLKWLVTAPALNGAVIATRDNKVIRRYGPWSGAGLRGLRWNGKDSTGRLVPTGTYVFVIAVRNSNGCYNERRGTIAVRR